MKIAFGCDHAGFSIKGEIIAYMAEKGHHVEDVGTFSEESVDYPVYAQKAAQLVACGECDVGILICGTGVGISIAANKVKGIRCVVCSEPYSAKLSREHNNANMLAFGARVVGVEMAKMIVDTWLTTEFQGGKHQKRVDLISRMEKDNDI